MVCINSFHSNSTNICSFWEKIDKYVFMQTLLYSSSLRTISLWFNNFGGLTRNLILQALECSYVGFFFFRRMSLGFLTTKNMHFLFGQNLGVVF